MEFSQKNKIGLSVVSATLFALFVCVYLALQSNFRLGGTNLPEIQGVFFNDPMPIQTFRLIDHTNQPFDNSRLQGKWHLLSYGYTHCPDICPTTLATLSRVVKTLNQENNFSDLGLLFYTVDPQRDSIAHLAEYVVWFDQNMIGLSPDADTENSYLAFEKSLGISSMIIPNEQDKSGVSSAYNVGHGIAIYLLNPEGMLQAIFKPKKNNNKTTFFTKEQIIDDYKAIRNFVG